MKKPIVLIAIPLIVILTAVLGSLLTSGGMDWYDTINLPTWTPDGSIIGVVWTTLFLLMIIASILAYLKVDKKTYPLLASLFLLQAMLNVLWSDLFFNQHLLWLAFVEAILLGLSVLGYAVAMWKTTKIGSLLLAPYVLWVFFASFLTYSVAILN
ncbi:MAG: TspO/MBR family protein [Patescibacteria group bacterium]|jgi:tryptophan-rich sensory protein